MLWFVCPKTICSPSFPQHLSTLIKRGLRVGHPILRRQNRMDNTGERDGSNGAQYEWPAEMVVTYSPTYVHTIQTKFNIEHTRVGVTHALPIKLLLHISTGRRASTWWGVMTLHIYTVHWLVVYGWWTSNTTDQCTINIEVCMYMDLYMTKQETLSHLNHQWATVDSTRKLSRVVYHGIRNGLLLQIKVLPIRN